MMTFKTHIFFIFCIFSILLDNAISSAVFEKFTKKYWLNKRNLEKFGENIKGIKLVQDEFRTGIINLPEVKRYLQREMLENAVRRRKHLDDQNSAEAVSLATEASLIDMQLSLTSEITPSSTDDGRKASDDKLSKTEFIKRRSISDESGEQVHKTEKRKIYKRMVLHDQENIVEGEDDNTENGKENEESNRTERREERHETGQNNGNEGNSIKEKTEDVAAEEEEYEEERLKEEEKSTLTENGDTSKLKFDHDKLHVTVIYPDRNNKFSISLNEYDSPSSEIDDNDQYEQSDDECDAPKGISTNKVESTSKNATENKKVKMIGILKTNISILAIWIVGICLSVCLLTCGCFYLYIVCLGDKQVTEVQSTMPVKCVPECPRYIT